MRILERSCPASLVPESIQIAEPIDNTLGSFVMRSIGAGAFVPLGDRHAIQADFTNIDVLVQGCLLEDFRLYKAKLIGQLADVTPVKEALTQLPEALQETFLKALYAANVANDFFGEKLHDQDQRDSTGWKIIDEGREDSYKVKKLSETHGDGVCAEYSLFAGEIMRQLGEDVCYTVGYRQDWSDEPNIYHAFLTADDTRILIDVYSLAETLRSAKPFGLMTAPDKSSLLDNPEDPVIYTDLFGRRKTYSAVRILPEQNAA